MPPKAKFTRDEIVAAALQIVQSKGRDGLSARNLANVLHSSSRPIFTVFLSMEELQDEVLQAARNIYQSYVEIGLKENPAFKGAGLQYIRFACEEPKLFQLLFMNVRGGALKLDNILPMIDQEYGAILKSLEDTYHIYGEQSIRLYQHIWIYTHGIAVLSATNMSDFKPEEISALLTEVFTSLLKSMREDTVL